MHAIRNARAQQSRMLRHAVRTTDAHAFFNLLTDDSTLDQVEVQLPMHQKRGSELTLRDVFQKHLLTRMALT